MARSVVDGGNIVAKNIIAFGKKFLAEVNDDMERVRFVLDAAVTRNISLTDHTLKDLADMGHPYSRRSGTSLHDPNYQVHRQSGDLLRGKFSGVETANIISGTLDAAAWVGIQGVDYAVHLVFGTSKMLPRDFLRGSLSEVREEALNILRRSLNNAVVSFDGEQVRL